MLTDHKLSSNDSLTILVHQLGIKDWSALCQHVRHLNYGRNSNNADFSLVLTEARGTCSSKHALLKKLAVLNHVPGVKLMLCIFKMNNINTPKIGNTLLENGLKYLPEAHCYLKIDNQTYDFTNLNSEFEKIKNDIIEEHEIEAEQVTTYKSEYHQKYLVVWIELNNLGMDISRLWEVREQCILKLSSS